LTLPFVAVPQLAAPLNDWDVLPDRLAGANGPVDSEPLSAVSGMPVMSMLMVPVECLLWFSGAI
jgi:hypothetical protein